ncbi:DUF1311 domain-containing protein [Gemmobacter lutimaris]|uniref:DUF1311 domain-containing protein n=1 Tax=Gemmobacter lutimaris TaxID=2306023 RepID=A0A398BRU0_9RHOB|nr:lysozyme inhibitor LprI family protein [Gemmobacter lutimaris]RID90630.1 DUF1311 domain-containing protein [Gemmobacter lutimaris]
MLKPASLALLALSLPAAAQEVDCANPTFQMEMTYCAEQDWNRADVALNAAYKEARALLQRMDAELPADQRGAAEYLKKAQRAWIEFRDAACAAEGYLMHGGSAEPMLVYSCLARLTDQRTGDLAALATAP